MIRIGRPVIETSPEKVVLKSFIQNEGEGINEWLWYAVEPEYGQYLCDEVADAFVLPMILRATRSKQDIVVEAPMSEKLLYNLQNAVLYAASKSTPYFEPYVANAHRYCPKIECEHPVVMDFQGKAVGTGCSLGIDSFMVLYEHYLEPQCPDSYKVTHLTFFNVGAMGSDACAATTESFKRDGERIHRFADKIGLPLVFGDSNVHIFYPEHDFNWSHTYRNMGMVLALQKLFGKYLYASGYDIMSFGFDHHDSAQYESFLLPHLSTESTDLISANTTMKRSEKVSCIAKNKVVQENLYVCLREQSENDRGRGGNIENSSQKLNCGHCMKCERTMLQLDILGLLPQYAEIFDTRGWEKRKDKYVGMVLAYRKEDYWYEDLYHSMIVNKYPISFKARLRGMLYKPYRRLRGHK